MMTVPEILQRLWHIPDKADFAPYEAALNAAVAQREAITPELIAALDRAADDPQGALGDQDDYLPHFAIYLLAQFREPRALDSFLRFFSLPGESALDLTGDTVTEHGAAVLASVCGGDPAPLLRLVHDVSVNDFVREQAILGLLVQHGWGERTREAVIADLRGLFDTLPRPGNSHVWAALVGAVCDFNASELLPEARRAFAEKLVDENIINAKSLVELESPEDARLAMPPTEDPFSLLMERNAPIHAVAECSGWLCFRDEDEEDGTWEKEEDEKSDERFMGDGTPYYAASAEDIPRSGPLQEPPAPTPYLAPPKIGRNAPCPCGSGKKYKKCCGQN